jgi:hypothetical protein
MNYIPLQTLPVPDPSLLHRHGPRPMARVPHAARLSVCNSIPAEVFLPFTLAGAAGFPRVPDRQGNWCLSSRQAGRTHSWR